MADDDLIVELPFEGRKRRFRIAELPPCRNLDRLRRTGVVYESFPRQFELECTCGCGHTLIAGLAEEEDRAAGVP